MGGGDVIILMSSVRWGNNSQPTSLTNRHLLPVADIYFQEGSEKIGRHSIIITIAVGPSPTEFPSAS